MKFFCRGVFRLSATILLSSVLNSPAQTPAPAPTPTSADGPYKIVNTIGFVCPGRFDYFYADSEARRLYIPQGDYVMVFDLDTLQRFPNIMPKINRGYGIAVDPVSHHAFGSGNSVLMWDMQTSQPIKTIDVEGSPYHNILFEPLTERIFVFTHYVPPPQPKAIAPSSTASSPVVPTAPPSNTPPPNSVGFAPLPPGAPALLTTVLDAKDGSVVGTLDVGGTAEQAVSDGQGHIYVDIRDKDTIAVIDPKTLKVTATFSLDGKGHEPCGLALDVKNHILFVFCLDSSNAVIMDATNGKILQSLPVGHVPENAVFNPATMEAFSSQGEGTLTILKENSPTSFAVEQTLPTFTHGRTCALDAKTNHVIVIAPEHLDKSTAPGAPDPTPATTSNVVLTPTGSVVPVTVAPPAVGTSTAGNSGASATTAASVVHRGVALHIYVIGR